MNDQSPATPATEPIDEPIFSPAQVQKIAAQLERDTGCTVDRVELADDLEFPVEFFMKLKSALPGIRLVRSWHRAMYQRADAHYRQFESTLRELCDGGHLSEAPTMLEYVERIGAEIKSEMHKAQAAAPRRGQPSNRNLRANLYRDLAGIYERHTDQDAGTSTIRDRLGRERGRGGPFVNFVAEVMDVAEPGRKRKALGTSVRAALRGRQQKE